MQFIVRSRHVLCSCPASLYTLSSFCTGAGGTRKRAAANEHTCTHTRTKTAEQDTSAAPAEENTIVGGRVTTERGAAHVTWRCAREGEMHHKKSPKRQKGRTGGRATCRRKEGFIEGNYSVSVSQPLAAGKQSIDKARTETKNTGR